MPIPGRIQGCQGHSMIQKLIEPSPFRPQTTMAIEKLNMAANEAQPNVNSMILTKMVLKAYLVSCVCYLNWWQLS